MKIIKEISGKDIELCISDNDLKLYKDIWHYSFGPVKSTNKFYFVKNGSDIFLFAKPFDQWSPVCCYTNNQEKDIETINFLGNPREKNDSRKKFFWYLNITTLEEFLQRRDEISNQPDKNFPTTTTYNNIIGKINKTFTYTELDENYFIAHYNSLKKENYLDGTEIIALLKRAGNIPADWLRMGVLYDNDKLVSIAVLVDDGKSVSLFNLATQRSKFSYGSLLCTEIIKHSSLRNYLSFDCGVSGTYGNYKSKIFLDSYQVCEKENIFLPERGFIKKIFNFFK